jgi:photosystem II stability/assembly factor-like uncharacterized protein
VKARFVLAVVVVLSALVAAASPSGREPSCRGELVSPGFGWAVCDRQLLVTQDGRAWLDVTPPRLLFQVEDVVFLDRSRGWVVANDCVRGKAYVYRTSDGGQTWSAAAAPTVNCAAGSRLQLSFVDERRGWLNEVVENAPSARLSRTDDGGKRWKPVSELPALGAVVFRTPEDGWLGRANFAQPQQLSVTWNGGRTWHQRLLAPPRGWSGARAFPDVPTFFGEQGVLPVMLSRSGRSAVAFYATGDGGRTWRLRAVRPVVFRVLRPRNPFVWYVPTAIADPDVWWLAGGRASPSVSITSDRGRTWRTFHPAGLPRASWWAISAASPRRGWLTTYASDVSRLFATSDGGRTWRQLSPR